MKYINSVRNVNRGLMVITIILYATIILGLCFQIVLGAYQVLIALILLFYKEEFTKKTKNNLSIYFISVLIFGMFWLMGAFDSILNYWFIPYAIIPMGFAFFFSIFLEELKLKECI